MLAGPHMAVGAVIARATRRAWLALPLAFASHYVLDALPHAYTSLRDPRALPLKIAIVTADALIGLALVLWIARRQPRRRLCRRNGSPPGSKVAAALPPRRRLILAGAFAAAMVDLMNPVTSLGVWLARLPGVGWLISRHINLAWHVPFGEWLLGFGPAFAVLSLTALAAYHYQRATSASSAASER